MININRKRKRDLKIGRTNCKREGRKKKKKRKEEKNKGKRKRLGGNKFKGKIMYKYVLIRLSFQFCFDVLDAPLLPWFN